MCVKGVVVTRHDLPHKLSATSLLAKDPRDSPPAIGGCMRAVYYGSRTKSQWTKTHRTISKRTNSQEDKNPGRQKPRRTKSKRTKSQEDKNPGRQKPRRTKSQGDKSPGGQHPSETKTKGDKSPGGQNPTGTKTHGGQYPRVQNPRGTKSQDLCICICIRDLFYILYLRAGILRGGGGLRVLEKAGPWECSYWQVKK